VLLIGKIVLSMGSIISTIISSSFYGTIFGFTLLGLFLHKTLPSDESFHTFRSKTEPTSGISFVDKIVVNSFSTLEFKNYQLFKTVTLRGSKNDVAQWFGIANNWYRNDTLLKGVLN